MPLPFSDKKGNMMTWDLSGLIPFFDLMSIPFHDEVEPIKTVALRNMPVVVKPFMSAFNVGSFGQPVYDENDPVDVQTLKVGKSIALGLAPGLMGQYWARMVANEAKGEKNKKSLFQIAIAQPMIGRIDNFTMTDRMTIASIQQLKEVTAIKKENYKIHRNRGRFIDEKEFQRRKAILERKLTLLHERHKATMLSGEGK